MKEEALDAPAPEAGEASEGTARPRTRRRRRGSRGRSRSGSTGGSPKGSADGGAAAEGSTPTEAPRADADEGNAGGKGETASAKRRRRRRRRKAAGEAAAEPSSVKAEGSARGKEAEAAGTADKPDEDAEPPKTRRRRRRGGRKRSGAAAEDGEKSDAAVKSTKAKAPAKGKKAERPAKDGQKTTRRRRATKKATEEKPAAAEGTRTRSRRKTPGRRRRGPEIRAPRRTDKTMVISERGDRDQIAVLEGTELVEHYITRVGATSMVGNIYVGKVQNVLPGMEAAFVDVGRGRNAVLYSGEVAHDEDVDGEQPPIEKVLKPGQSVMVQVSKDPMGGKGARLTGQVSLPGRYLVYVPDGSASGISRRLPDKERTRLRGILKEIQPKTGGVIVRTAAEGASEDELSADLARLRKTWDSLKRKSRRGRVPKVVYEEPELTVKVVRDVFSPTEFERVVTDSKPVHEKVTAYLEDVAPDLVDRVELRDGALPVFEEFHVSEQIHKALERKVWLPSGGYIIVDRTEAMTIIDVNTGKHVGKTNLEETVAQTNLEAAGEIARQLRLRDIGGIIVIDFIDMLLQRNRDLVVETLKQALAADRTRSQVFDITPLGLLEMTRKRVSAGLVESFSETCPTCEGRGILLTHEA